MLLQATFLMPPLPTTLRTLYLHFPFCARICPFCAFTVRKDRPAAHDAYGAGLLQELQLRLATGLTPFDESGNSVRPELAAGLLKVPADFEIVSNIWRRSLQPSYRSLGR